MDRSTTKIEVEAKMGDWNRNSQIAKLIHWKHY